MGSGPAVFRTFLRAEQRAKLFTGIRTTAAIVTFSLSMILVFIFEIGVRGLFIGSICMLAAMHLFILFLLRQQGKLILSTFSLGFLIEALRFGMPLIPAELANIISYIGDRYVLQFFLGSQAVGLYTVGMV